MEEDKLNIKSTGFNTPKDYFDTFDEILMSKISETKQLKIVKDTGYVTPKDYFKNLDRSIIKAVSKNEPSVITINKKRIAYYITGIAASILLCIGLFSIINTDNTSLSTEMVSDYLENSDLNSYELAELLSENNLLEENFSVFETNYTEAPLEDYILQSETDLELLLETIQ